MYNPELMQQRLKMLREQKRLSQRMVAERVGITQGTLCLLEYGKHIPNLNTIDCIADFYGVSLDWLCGRTEKTPHRRQPGTGLSKKNKKVRDYHSIIGKDCQDEKF